MSRRCLEDFWKVSRRCPDVVWKASGGYLEGVGRSLENFCMVSGRCLGNINIILSVWGILDFSDHSVSIIEESFFVKLPSKLLNLIQLELNGVEL